MDVITNILINIKAFYPRIENKLLYEFADFQLYKFLIIYYLVNISYITMLLLYNTITLILHYIIYVTLFVILYISKIIY